MPKLILIRHGNTFEAGQTPVWVGARTDMPLTATGEAQAEAAARAVACDAPFAAIIAGPLQRTRRTAAIIAASSGQEVHVDDRLREIDYGQWEGLSNDAIAQRFGAAVLEPWEKQGVWPEGMGWSPSLAALRMSLTAFLDEQRRALATDATTRLAVTSNGILRIVHALVGGGDAAAKVKTGHICVLEPEGEGWRVVVWNQKPSF